MVNTIICCKICSKQLITCSRCLAGRAANFETSGATRANGIYSCLVNSKCVLGLHAAVPILELLETLNRSLQGSSVQVDGMIESVRLVKTELLKIRTSETFSEIFNKAHMTSVSLGLESS